MGLPVVQPLTSVSAIDPLGCGCCIKTPADSLQESESAESFAFALVNGSLGVFEMRGRRVRDFKYNFCTNAISVFFFSLSCYLILQHCLNLTKC